MNTQPLDLNAIQARCDAATPGPWYVQPKLGENFVAAEVAGYERGIGGLAFGDGDEADADREFVLNAHRDITALLARVRELEAENERLRVQARELQIICAVCAGPAGYIDCPTGGWWAHADHPTDGHDAEPVQRAPEA